MSEIAQNALEATDTQAALAYAADRRKNVRVFVRTNGEYYIRQFDRIGASAKFTPTFNPMAGLFGSIWFGARGLWSWALPFLVIEMLVIVQIARGMFGDLAADAFARIASIEGTLELRRQQLAAAIETGSVKIDVYRRTVDALEDAIGGIRDEAIVLSEQGIWIALTGLIILVIVKAVQSMVANWALEARFSDWLSNRSLRLGLPVSHVVFSATFMVLIVIAAVLHYSLPGRFSVLSDFPTDPDYRLNSICWVDAFFAFCVANGEVVFDFVTYGKRMILDALELVFVKTPWIVIASLILLLTWLTAAFVLRSGQPVFWPTWGCWGSGKRR